jgi:hypothetical protein
MRSPGSGIRGSFAASQQVGEFHARSIDVAPAVALR